MRILVVEDDPKTARLLVQGLHDVGWVVDLAPSAGGAEELTDATDYDVIMLDWLLPDREGIHLCRDLRNRGLETPILMLTALDAIQHRVDGLNAGADDYLVKPFAFAELVARLQALLRRRTPGRVAVLTVGDLTLDPLSHEVTRGGAAVSLTPKEYALLEVLMRQPRRVVTRSQLAEGAWESESDSMANLVDVHISHLRRKIDRTGVPPLIHTVRNYGYRIGSEPA